MTRVRWKADPDDHDYPAAQDYLELVMTADDASSVVEELRVAVTIHRKSKDVLRASGLAPLGAHNRHVAKDLQRIDDGVALSPVLLVRGDARLGAPLIIADGFHRVCAAHLVDEDVEVPCRIAEPPPRIGSPG